MQPDIRFPGLGIEIQHLSKGFDIFGFHIAWYGVLIAVAMFTGVMITGRLARKTGQKPEAYYDFLLGAIIVAVIGARLYYVLFSWSEFSDNPLRIFNLRTGGLAIYGGIIGGVLMAIRFSKKSGISFGRIVDTCAPGIIAGQAIGRWGNFINREAFGGYTDNLFAMQIKYTDVTQGNLNPGASLQTVIHEGVQYLQVHPTFLYESIWNVFILVLLLVLRKRMKFDGELFCLYLGGYGIGRFIIEGLRTDQLRIFGVAVSQALGLMLFIFAVVYIFIRRRRAASETL
ncbi:MAG: prolipoprotein diacylglyceryl transferase [Eubacteriales bacterium]|nr:prolipoprotein diacylglyceryl transferase [Eubacteriales bacterium]